MLFEHRKFLIARIVMILALLTGLFGMTPVPPAHAGTIIVTNTNDTGAGSFRQAISDAVSGDTITFSSLLAGQTITLASNLIIDKGLTIDGSGLSPQVTISGGNMHHIEVPGSGPVTISDLTITNGYAAIYGGAIFKSGPAELAIRNSTITQNQASGGGAISNTGSGDVTIVNTTITGNQAVQGGAIDSVAYGDIVIVNSTITENEATVGGAIAIGGAELRVYNSTFAANIGSSEGTELYSIGTGAKISLYNTILACLPGDNGCIVSMAPIPIEYINSIVDYGTVADFGLAERADNGGRTQTMALLPGSPLIDAGDDELCANAPVNNLDQRGASRSQGDHCDIGAYEDLVTVRYVKGDANGANNGSSWEDAYTDLQAALAAASPDEEIWVAAGTYKPTSTTDRSISFTLKNGVSVFGGFVGTETERTQRDYQTNLTILSADIGVQGDNSDNSYHVVVASNTNTSAFLDGFTVTGGNADDASINAGGGMYSSQGSPSLSNVIFTNNYAILGAGMSNYQSSPILTNVTFLGNSASWYAGGMSNEDNSNPRLTDVMFDGNTAESDTAQTAAGGMHNRGSSPNLRNVTFKGNSANFIGGGMVNELGSSPDLVNVTFSNNSADYGGAMLNRDANSNPTLAYVTMSNNIALGEGGAIANAGNPVITNSILWGNTGGEIFNLSGTPVITYSIVQGSYTGTGNLDQDPLLGLLQDNGGFTQTMALGDGSPAINTADDANCPDTDQRGVARPLGSHCDMGAYEYDHSTVDVFIDEVSMGSYLLAPQESQRQSYPGMNNGPVQLINTDNAKIMAAERVIYKVDGVNTSFSEMMGLPNNQLDTVYWLPWYNNVDLDTQLRFANVSGATATVHLFIGEQEMNGSPFTLAAGESTRKSFPGINNGPVKIQSDVNIVAAERVIYKVNSVNTSFSEMMALPDSQLDATYWLPWYNNRDLDTQLRIANVSALPAVVHIYIGGTEMTGSPFTLAVGESTRKSFAGINNGPVKIVSDQAIVAAERAIYRVNGKNTSFSEMMALPDGQLNTIFWLPWFNNKDLDTQLRFANTANMLATVRVYIGGTEMNGSPFTLLAGESTRRSFAGINNGPVKIVSDVPIVAAERVIYTVNGINTSFSEMMGLPNGSLDATFWFPWYNNLDLDTQLRFGLP